MPRYSLLAYLNQIHLIRAFAGISLFTLSCTPSNTTTSSAAIGSDPLYASQWHLKNGGGNTGSVKGEDVNVESVFNSDIKGKGVTIAVVDDGLDILHEDLKDNLLPGKSYNYLDETTDLSSKAGEHGTACAGIIAARDLNNLGGRGVAPRAALVGYNFLQSSTTVNGIDALTRNASNIWVSNNSWGTNGCTGLIYSANTGFKAAIDSSLTKGRDGKGTVYVFSAGNGAGDSGGSCAGYGEVDNANYDEMNSHYGIILVGAIGDNGKKAPYSEKGANLWTVAPSLGSTKAGIVTTDLAGSAGYNMTSGYAGYLNIFNYTNLFRGTSAAAPMVSGVVALMLEANPKLGWRDVKLILARSARKNDSSDTDWTTNGASPPYNINHKYGFGAVDAAAAVALAKTWTNLTASLIAYQDGAVPKTAAIPDNNSTGLSSSFTVQSGITTLEHVLISIVIDHPSPGELTITLKSPSGTSSTLSEQHTCLDDGVPIVCNSYYGVSFGSTRYLGEKADGTWTLTVKDLASGETGTLAAWGMFMLGI